MADRREKIILGLDAGPYIRGLASASTATKAFVKDLDSSDSRMGNLVQTSLALGPALVPIGAAAVPAVAALTAGLGAAAGAAGVAALAFNGVGEGLGALNDYQLEPSAKNLEKVRQAFEDLGPAGTNFVMFLDDLEPKLDKLQNTARAGLLPGVEDGIRSLMDRAPQVNRIIGEISGALGDLAAEGGQNLAGPKFRDFFDYIESEARPILQDMGRTLGNVVEGVSNMLVEFDPLTDNFSNGLLGMSRDFAKWTRQLDNNQGFQEFVDYVQRVSPKALETLGAVGLALADIVEAAAPVGEVTLPVIKALARVLSAVAESPAGPVLVAAAAGLSAVSRSIAVFNAANGSALVGSLRGADKEGGKFSKTASKLSGVISGRGALAGGVGVLALSFTDLDEKMGISNTAMGVMLGTMAGPWGAAIGGGIGLAKDLAEANDDLEDSLSAVDRAAQDPANLEGWFGAIDEAEKELVKRRKEVRKALGGEGVGESWLDDPTGLEDAFDGWWADEAFNNGLDDAAKKLSKSEREAIGFRKSLSSLRALVTEDSGFGGYTKDLGKLRDFAERSRGALRKMGYSMKEFKEVDRDSPEFLRIAAGIRHFNRVADSAPGRSSEVGKALKHLNNPMKDAATSADKLSTALDAVFTPALNADQAMQERIESLIDLRKQLRKTNGEFDWSTNATRESRAAIRDHVSAIATEAKAMAERGDGTRKISRYLREQRKDLLRAFPKEAREEAKRLIDRTFRYGEIIRGLPKTAASKVSTPGLDKSHKDVSKFDKLVRSLNPFHDTKIDAPGSEQTTKDIKNLDGWVRTVPDQKSVRTDAPGAKKARDEIVDVQKAIGGLFGKTVGIDLSSNASKIVSTVQDIFSSVFNADGNVLEFYANGDVRNGHTAQIAPAGAMRVWAEPETGGEAYIPLAPSKRKRSLDIWQETGRRLGVDGYADGAVLVQADTSRPKVRAKHPQAIDGQFTAYADYLGKRLSKIMSEQLERLSVGMHWPLPKRYGYSGSWGSYPSGGSHPALDFPAPRGTPIYAVLPGRVQHTTSLGDSYGNYTEISHGKGLSSLYAHQQRFATKAGARVGSGETIGYVNSTGNSTGDHLHLEMQRNGNSFDYTRMLKKAGGLGILGPGGMYEGSHDGLNRAGPAKAKAYARSIMPRYGWKPFQWSYWNDLGNRESGWRWNATNPSSGAYGIPQSLPAEKMASSGSDWRTNVGTQLDWMAGYMAERYGGPYGAIQHHNANNWYADGGISLFDNGGLWKSGTVGLNASGRDELVIGPDLTQLLRGLNKLLREERRRDSGSSRNRGLLQPFDTRNPRRRGFRAPDLVERAEREVNRHERRLKRTERNLDRTNKALDRAEKAVKNAKGEVEKQEARTRLRNLEERLDAERKNRDRAERDLQRARDDKRTAKQDQKTLDRAFKRFDIKGGMDRSEVRAEVNELIGVVKDTVGKDSRLFKSLDRFRDRLDGVADRLDEERKERAKLNEQLKETRQRQREFASSVAGNFKNDPFSGGLDEFYLQTRADRNDAQRFNRLRGRANRLGLDGPLMKAILASGNVELLGELVRGGRSEIRKAENAYERRNKAAGQLGENAGRNVFGDQIRRQNRTLNHLDKTIRHLENRIQHLGNKVREGAEKGSEKGTRDGNKHKNKLLQQFTVEARG